ncbi:hypothetical protein Nepgr_028539 [Nepenthes gracilis]|uniref:AB hydrolase-1 domain-containing protein n=1 Tax=Nepenthes gracilis TaxID=150966 RepID=A0AAD3TCQ7_NEPGR|nr:hypothetical protein Nepgr_028539 [Nepenthes gracilis]
MVPALVPLVRRSQSAAEILVSVLTFTVFTILDFLDAIFCVFYAYLDEFLEGSASQCHCHKREETGKNENVCDRENQLSETLYGRENIFRELGLLRLRRKSEQSIKSAGNLNSNRWSDCGCESCLSWMKNGDLKLHVAVQESSAGDSTENVVFFHGFMSSSSHWTETVFKHLSEPLKENYRLIAVDLLGFGRSPKPRDISYTLRDHLEMIEKSVIFPYNLKSFHLVAHSMGCVIALALAARYPESVKSLTLVAPPYFPSSVEGASLSALNKIAGKRLWPPLLFGAALMSWYEHLGRTVCFLVCRNHGLWESILRLLTRKRDLDFAIIDLTRHTHHSAWHTMHNVICGGAALIDDYLETISKHKIKFTIIQGDCDRVVPLECSYNIKRKVPDVDVLIVPNTDHTTVSISRKTEFTRDLEHIWLGEVGL